MRVRRPPGTMEPCDRRRRPPDPRRHSRIVSGMLFSCALALVLPISVSAGPGAETGDSRDPRKPAGSEAMVIPPISPVALGEGEGLRVVASTGIIGDVVSQVAGGLIDMAVLIRAGQDPHGYQTVPRDMATVENAHIVFVNGLDLEESLVESIENVAIGAVVPVSAGLDASHREDDAHDNGDVDPHFWVDPRNVIRWVDNIVLALGSADPANQIAYVAAGAAYRAQLVSLDGHIRKQIDRIPPHRRKLVTDHWMFGYFADAYGFELVGAMLPGLSTTSGASAGEVARLVERIRDHEVPAVFVGATAGRRLQNLSRAISEELGSNIRVIELYTGSLAPEGEPGDTYLGYMRHNVNQIVDGLSAGLE